MLIALAGCDLVLGLNRTCDEARFGSECSTCGAAGQACCAAGTTTCGEGLVCGESTCTACGGVGQPCCAGETTCGDGLFCGGGTCSECVIDVAPGRRHMCSLRYDGTVWCSGQNNTAQLGRAPSDARSATPAQVMGADGAAFGDAVSLGSGRDHSCAVRRDGTVWCWGRHSEGQLGDNTPPRDSEPVPVQVIQADGLPLTNIVSVSAGNCHTCAMDGAGGVACWGCNYAGQLGDGGVAPRPFADPVLDSTGVPFTGVAELSVAHQHACARRSDATAWCWGNNKYGQVGNGMLGDGTYQPYPAMALDDVESLGAGSYFTCATRRDGTAWCWGRAFGNRLGDGKDDVPEDRPRPGRVLEDFGGGPFMHASRISVGSVGCLVTNDTGVWCWGNDQYGTTGGFNGSSVPAPVIDREGNQLAGVDRLVGHNAHTCAHQTTGRYVCWGRNSHGELANGTTVNTGRPSTVALTCP